MEGTLEDYNDTKGFSSTEVSHSIPQLIPYVLNQKILQVQLVRSDKPWASLARAA